MEWRAGGGNPLRPGDQILIFFMWYAVVRFLLENLRTGNWFVSGIATAQLMSILFGLGAFLLLVYRHRRPMDVPTDPDDEFDDLDDDDDDDAEDDEVEGARDDDDDADVDIDKGITDPPPN